MLQTTIPMLHVAKRTVRIAIILHCASLFHYIQAERMPTVHIQLSPGGTLWMLIPLLVKHNGGSYIVLH